MYYLCTAFDGNRLPSRMIPADMAQLVEQRIRNA